MHRTIQLFPFRLFIFTHPSKQVFLDNDLLMIFELNMHLNRALFSFLFHWLFNLFFSRSGISINQNVVDVSFDIDSPHKILVDLCYFDIGFHLLLVLIYQLLQLIVLPFMLSIFLGNDFLVLFPLQINDTLKFFDFMLISLHYNGLFINLFLQISVLYLSVSKSRLDSFQINLNQFFLIEHFWVVLSHLGKFLGLKLTLILEILDLKF